MSSADLLGLKVQRAAVQKAADKDQGRLGGCLGHLPLLARDGDGVAHNSASSSVCGNTTIAEAGEGSILPRGGSRFTQITPVIGIDPCQGWALYSDISQDGDGFNCCEYVARGADHDVHIPVSRFRSAFHPTQARFEFLVRNGFAEKPARHCSGPWDDQCIDRAIAAERRAVAA